ncbi:hypothetical protein CAI21_14120 [Alkalilimnicola ehrlichii]|uniref:Peptidyl-prolyl cis-trans isomerase n=1 Tax=Alkalilimnicola ehrlichii TaxID=351052 RepID=A0A3E0WKW7_9GAMM|nr:hypothetical protein CAI21_14120 [Alkalilimnicola ehrlichii]RFA33604.1 hypothetical protein CAL65_17300 [Alkalilimnicola ehrlichii]
MVASPAFPLEGAEGQAVFSGCMERTMKFGRFFGIVAAFALGLSFSAPALSEESGGQPVEEQTMVVFSTNYGDIKLELFPEEAPITVENFLSYVDAGFYNGTIFHRVIPGFVIQGGGFDTDMNQKPTEDPIKNEADNGLKNERGTLSMARTQAVDSATSQFFINLTDNAFLDHGTRDFGYAVLRGLSKVWMWSIRSPKSKPATTVCIAMCPASRLS